MKRIPGLALAALVLSSCSAAVVTTAERPDEPEVLAEVLALAGQAQMRLELGEISEALRLYKEAAELAPEESGLAEDYGLALARVGMMDEAAVQLSRADSLSADGDAILGILLMRSVSGQADIEKALPHLEAGVESVAHGTQTRIELVRALIDLSRGDEAFRALAPLLPEGEDDPRLLLLAGQALRLQGKFPEAIEYLRRAAAAPRAGPRVKLELADVLAASGGYREAADVMGELLQREGATLGALTHWATLLVRAGDREKAIEVLDDVLERDGSFRDALVLRALLDADDGKLEGAEQLYRRALAINPSDPDVALGLARVLIDLRRLDEARALLDGVWLEVEKLELSQADAGVDVAQERATLELVDRKTEAARQWLEKLRAEPLSRRSLALWTEYFRQRKAYGEGLEFLRGEPIRDDEATARARASSEIEFLLALGAEGEAGKAMEPLLAGTEEDVLAAVAAVQRQKRYDRGVEMARQALERFPDSHEISFALAASLERSGQWDQAVDRFRELLAEHPDDAASLNYLGYMFADKGVNLDEAKNLITRALELEPSTGAYLDSLGWVYFRLQDYGRAEKHLTEAARLEPFDATVHEHLGELYMVLGEFQRARDSFQKALACDLEEAGQAERIRERLAVLVEDEKN